MARPTRDSQSIVEIARLRYDQGLPQNEIAIRLGISESTVSRALKRAFDLGILEVQIAPAGWRDTELEARLRDKFGLKQAIVVEPRRKDAGGAGLLARAAAAYLEDQIVDGTVLGVSDGESVAAVAEAFRRARSTNVDVVSLIGGIGAPQISTHSTEISRVLASNIAGRPWQMHAPALVDSAEMAEALKRSISLKRVFELISATSIVLVGIGSMSPRASIFRHGTISPSQISVLQDGGAVGSICGRFYDHDGQPVDNDLNGRIMAATLHEVRRAPVRVGVATGLDKLEAIRGALRGVLVNVLCTDTETAVQLLS